MTPDFECTSSRDAKHLIDLLCIGEPMLELNQCPENLDGRRYFVEHHGGDTSNTSIAAARQGARVAYATAIGRDQAGESFLALWREEKVDTSFVRIDPTSSTGVYLVTHSVTGHAFSYYRRGSAASRMQPGDIPCCAIENARMVYASGVSQAISTEAADTVFEAIHVARQSNRQIAYDTNYRPSLWPRARAAAIIHSAISQSDIALPSLDDAVALTGLDDPDCILDFYLRLGPKIVALKMGAQGTALATPSARLRIPPFPCHPVDATGAGDTFCGSFLARVLAGDHPEQAARYAACAAALSTEGFGAVHPIPRTEDVLRALRSHVDMARGDDRVQS